MLRDEAVEIVKRRLAYFRGDSGDVVGEMKLAQETLERGILGPHGGVFWPWFLLRQAVIGDVSGETVAAPEDFLHDYEWEALWLVEDGGRKRPLERVDRGRFEFGEGEPKRFELVGGTIFLDPRPAEPVTLELVYYGRDQRLEGNIENLWLRYAPDLLIFETVRAMGEALQMGTSVRLAREMAAEAKRTLWATTMGRVLEEREIILGGDR